MAMALTVGGKKNGFDKESFLPEELKTAYIQLLNDRINSKA